MRVKKQSRRITLLELVQAVQDTCRSDAEVIAVISHMVKTGRLVLPAAMRLATA